MILASKEDIVAAVVGMASEEVVGMVFAMKDIRERRAGQVPDVLAGVARRIAGVVDAATMRAFGP